MTPLPADDPAADPSVDMARLAELRALLGDMLDDILRTWLKDAPALLASARHALQAGHRDAAIHAVHGIKGNSSNVGAVALSLLARRLEAQLADDGIDDQVALAALAQLNAEYDNTARLIRTCLHS